jgi:hypothetical protein
MRAAMTGNLGLAHLRRWDRLTGRPLRRAQTVVGAGSEKQMNTQAQHRQDKVK